MPRIICDVPGADPELDGLEWTADRGQLISPELTEAQAARYASLPGFRLAEPPAPPEKQKAETKPKAAPATAAATDPKNPPA